MALAAKTESNKAFVEVVSSVVDAQYIVVPDVELPKLENVSRVEASTSQSETCQLVADEKVTVIVLLPLDAIGADQMEHVRLFCACVTCCVYVLP